MIPNLMGLNRKELRNAIRHLTQDNAGWPVELRRVADDMLPLSRPPALVAVWRSRTMLVQVFDEPDGEGGRVTRLSFSSTSLDPKTMRWKDGFSWDELQAAKNAIGYADCEAVEVYPPAANVVNVANMRHLWVLPKPLPFSWGDDKPTAFCRRCERAQPMIDGGRTCGVCKLVRP